MGETKAHCVVYNYEMSRKPKEYILARQKQTSLPAVRQIRVTNFKSFRDLCTDLPRFGVLIGANASGKSNFVQIFEFLRDLAYQGLDNAISLQGGIEFLRNMRIGSSSPLGVQLVVENDMAISK